MDPKHSGEMLQHLEEQDKFLKDAYRSMIHELRKLQVEEQMLMLKFHDLMSAHGTKKKHLDEVLNDSEPGQSRSLVNVPSDG
ncbi:hypothetical protein LguiA_017641 [Lonicera macranthoides]